MLRAASSRILTGLASLTVAASLGAVPAVAPAAGPTPGQTVEAAFTQLRMEIRSTDALSGRDRKAPQGAEGGRQPPPRLLRRDWPDRTRFTASGYVSQNDRQGYPTARWLFYRFSRQG